MFNIDWSAFPDLTLGEIAVLENLAGGGPAPESSPPEAPGATGPRHEPTPHPGITYERL